MLQPIWSMKSLAVGHPACPYPTQSALPHPTAPVLQQPSIRQTLPVLAKAKAHRMSGGETSWRRVSCIPSNSAMPNVAAPRRVIGPPGHPNPIPLVPARPANRLSWLLRLAETSSTLSPNPPNDMPLMSRHTTRKLLTAALPQHPFQHTQEQDNTTRNNSNRSNRNKRQHSAGKRTAHTRWNTMHR